VRCHELVGEASRRCCLSGERGAGSDRQKLHDAVGNLS
jgi:hypothetical protein